MNALKIAGIVFGIVVAVVLGGIVVLISQFDSEHIKSELAKAVQEKNQRTLKIDGALELSFWPNVGVRVGKLSLSEHASAQEFVAVDSARVSVAVLPLLSKRIVVNAIDVGGVKLALVKHSDGTLNIDDLLSKGKSESQPVQLDISGIKLTNAQLAWHDEKSGNTTTITGLDLATGRVQADTGRQVFHVEALFLMANGKTGAGSFGIRLDAPKLSISQERSGGETGTLTAFLTGPQRSVNVKLALAGIESTAQALKIDRLALDIDAKVGETAVKGTLNSALAGDLEHQALAFEKLVGDFDIANPQLPMKHVKLPLSGTLRANIAKQSVAGRLETQFDESRIALEFDIAKFVPLTLGFNLDVDQLNIDKYLPPKMAEEEKGGDGKLDFSALKNLNLNGAVIIGSVQVANIKATNVDLQLRAANGRLDIAPHAAALYDGTLSGSLSLDANGNAITAKETLAGININPLLKDAVDKDMIAGRGSVTLDVTTHGGNVVAMKKALNGSASIALKDGAIQGINLAQSFRDFKAKFISREDAVQQSKAGDSTDFSEMTASFKIADGVAHNDDLSVKSPFLRIGGAGDIDIGASRLNYLAKVSVVASTSGQGGKGLEYLKGFVVPVRLTGAFDNPVWKIEYAGLATQGAKAKLDEAKQAIKQKAGEQVKDKLKGLFGR